jgi:PDZ domain-containing protein
MSEDSQIEQRQPKRRGRRLLSTALVALILFALFQPVPYVLESPGPLFNTLGSVNDRELVSISGTQTYPTNGEINMTTVSVYGGPQQGVDLFQAIEGWFDHRVNVVPREQIYPDGVTNDQERQISVADFSSSQSDATAAALNYLHLPIKKQILITSVESGMPADGKLQAGDFIQEINGHQISSPEQAVALIRVPPVGRTITLKVWRDGSAKMVSVTTTKHPENKLVPYLGIGIDVNYQAKFNINFGVDDVGGPSGGTMFALAIIDKLTPGSITNGKVIAGTGTISPKGEVGPIGGIAQKMIASADHGAALFIAPLSNCSDIRGHVPAGLKVVPVSTLSEAVQVLKDFKAGKQLGSCPVEQGK